MNDANLLVDIVVKVRGGSSSEHIIRTTSHCPSGFCGRRCGGGVVKFVVKLW